MVICFGSASVFAEEPLGTPELFDIEAFDDGINLELVNLGKTLFFDNQLSKNRSISCASCHSPSLGFGDGKKTSTGFANQQLPRHSPSIYNMAWNVTFMWDGRVSSLKEQASLPFLSENEMGMSAELLVSRVSENRDYQDQFRRVFATEEITEEQIYEAIAAFEMTLISNNSAFDKYLKGEKNAMSPAAIRGLELFKGKAKCIQCHDGTNLTDNSFHNIGVGNDTDLGRGVVVDDESLNFSFKTPGLRNVALSPPYMHDGSIASLKEVIELYNEAVANNGVLDELIKPLNLADGEINDLVEFLNSLTDPVNLETSIVTIRE